jgi:hypothetical protein
MDFNGQIQIPVSLPPREIILITIKWWDEAIDELEGI